MKMVFKYIIVLVIIAVIVIVGKILINKKQENESSISSAINYDMFVKTISPKIEKATLSLPYLAITKSDEDVKISSRYSARIKNIIKSATAVKKGDIIVSLDNQELKSQLISLNLDINSLKSQIKAQEIALKSLEDSHKRTQKLMDVNGASKEQFDKEISNITLSKSAIKTLKYKIKQLEANRFSIKNMLSYSTIKSPINGVATKLANVGDMAIPGKPLISISTKSKSYLLLRLPDNTDAKALIYNNKRYKIDELNTTYNGLLEYIANIDESLVGEQTVNIDLIIYENKGYKLPHDSILNRDGKNYVLQLKNNKAIAKEVKILANAQQGVVVDNLEKDSEIVVAKQDILLKLLGGMTVKAVK